MKTYMGFEVVDTNVNTFYRIEEVRLKDEGLSWVVEVTCSVLQFPEIFEARPDVICQLQDLVLYRASTSSAPTKTCKRTLSSSNLSQASFKLLDTLPPLKHPLHLPINFINPLHMPITRLQMLCNISDMGTEM